MTNPALSSARNHQGRPWFGPEPVPTLKSGSVHATARHGRGSRRSLINGAAGPGARARSSAHTSGGVGIQPGVRQQSGTESGQPLKLTGRKS